MATIVPVIPHTGDALMMKKVSNIDVEENNKNFRIATYL